MTRSTLITGLLFCFVHFLWTSALAQRKCVHDIDDPDLSTAVIWRGDEPKLMLPDIVGLAAPVLWYSYDEPLLLRGEFPFPHPHPSDTSAKGAVVYYQVMKVMLRGGDQVTIPEQQDADFFRKVKNFTLRYFFYYRMDIGMNSHTHDLEVTEFEFDLEEMDDGC